MKGYCLKCKNERDMENANTVQTNGRKRLQGTCKTCGTKISVFVKKSDSASESNTNTKSK